jgi:outer membrane protein TolC
MKTILIITAALLASLPLQAQNSLGAVLEAIAANNTTLKALRETAEAQKAENRTGIYLSNPEVEFGYLWGRPAAEVGHRTDFSLKQSFDMATLMGMKSRLAKGQNTLVELQYRASRLEVLLEAKRYCIELVYCNALRRELSLRLEYAETIAAACRQRMDRGDASQLEYNKAQLNLAAAQGETARLEVERKALLLQLKRLNGGIDITLDDDQYSTPALPPRFDEWLAQAAQRNPVLEYARQEVLVGQRQLALSKASWLPALTAGYMLERAAGQQYQGLTLGLSLPLWENKNRVHQAKAAAAAAEWRETDSRQQFHSRMQALYLRATGLQAAAEQYRRSLSTASNTALLEKALDAGEISLLDYILETGLYYAAVNQTLEAERDYQLAAAELILMMNYEL